jgi:hypothetical protein
MAWLSNYFLSTFTWADPARFCYSFLEMLKAIVLATTVSAAVAFAPGALPTRAARES